MRKCINQTLVAGYATDNVNYGTGAKATYARLNVQTDREFVKNGESEVSKWNSFHNVAAFGSKAEELKDVRKGDFVIITGRSESRKYDPKDGNPVKRIHEIIVEIVHDVDHIDQSSAPVPAQVHVAQAPAQAPVNTPPVVLEEEIITETIDTPNDPFKTNEDDLPF